MQEAMKLLVICFIPIMCWSCRDTTKLDGSKKSSQVKDIKADLDKDAKDSRDADSQKQALEPVAIGGAYLNCQYKVTDNDEVWCRLEEEQKPLFIATSKVENWVFLQNSIPYPATAFDLDRTTGWQWGIKIPSDQTIAVSLDLLIEGAQYHFDTIISTGSDDTAVPPATQNLTNKYAYGQVASFVVDNNPFSSSAPASCLQSTETTTPDPSLPNLKFFFKAQQFYFPFKVQEEGSLVTIGVDEICGQMLPIHYAELIGMGLKVTMQIPVGARKVIVSKALALPAGDYQVLVHFVPRTFADLLTPERFAFGKVLLESDKVLQPGHAYGK